MLHIGSTFIASASGVVIKAEYNTAYGNMVMIDHGGGVITLYAHGSEILVDVGDTVTARNASTKSTDQLDIRLELMHILK